MALTFDHVQNDTIAAIATAMSEAGIGIIRVSGPDAASAVSKIYRTGKKKAVNIADWEPGTIRFGYIMEREEIIDEVMVSWMRSPHSYTTEDTVEINTHGGMFVMNRILQLVLQSGARMAQPGEFTKRAFLGGRIDLARAEAVMDLISSQNEFSRKTSVAQLEGSVSKKIRDLRSQILYEIAFIESALDDPENYLLDGYPENLLKKCTSLEKEMRSLLQHAEEGRLLKEGIRTVIAGRPNAGKSSLLNKLAGEERAIVTEVAGTTRDTLSETVRVGGILLHLTDTAGIRRTADKVEQIGVHRAEKALDEADLILFVTDTSRPLSEEDKNIAVRIMQRMREGAKCILLMNKSDLEPKFEEKDIRNLFGEICGTDHFDTYENDSNHNHCDNCCADNYVSYTQNHFQDKGKTAVQFMPALISCSLETGEGIDNLTQEISRLFNTGKIEEKNEIFITNIRHREAVRQALDSICLVEQSIRDGMSEDFFSIDLMNAYRELGTILGEAVEEDLVEEIFSRFCLGK